VLSTACCASLMRVVEPTTCCCKAIFARRLSALITAYPRLLRFYPAACNSARGQLVSRFSVALEIGDGGFARVASAWRIPGACTWSRRESLAIDPLARVPSSKCTLGDAPVIFAAMVARRRG